MDTLGAAAVAHHDLPTTILVAVVAPHGAGAARRIAVLVTKEQLLISVWFPFPGGVLVGHVNAVVLHFLLEGFLVVAVATSEEVDARTHGLALYARSVEELSAAGRHQHIHRRMSHLLGADGTQADPILIHWHHILARTVPCAVHPEVTKELQQTVLSHTTGHVECFLASPQAAADRGILSFAEATHQSVAPA